MVTQSLLVETVVFNCIGNNRDGFDYMYNSPMLLVVLQTMSNELQGMEKEQS